MTNFNITNSAEKELTIDILGEIGGSWFNDGITMQSVADQLEKDISKITLNISSLGGSYVDAIAIHDMLKMHSSKVEANILGMTASSGTIIAMGADVVNVSNNVMFLVHNASLGLHGNAEELRSAAEDLDKIDEIISSVYQRKINKSGKNKKKSEILALMSQEKWLSADEAISWGFADNKIKESKISNKIYNQINSSDLPKIKNTKMEIIEKIKALFTTDTTDEQLVSEIENLKSESVQAKADLTDLTNKFEAEKLKALEVDALKLQVSALQTEKELLKNEIEKIKASKTGLETNDPNISAGKQELTPIQKLKAEAFKGVKIIK